MDTEQTSENIFGYSLLYHASWLQVFRLFQLSSFLVKMVNHCEINLILQDIEHQLRENILHSIFIVVFCKIFIELAWIFNPLKTIHRKFRDIAHQYKHLLKT